MAYEGLRVQLKDAIEVYLVLPHGASFIPDPQTATNLFGENWQSGVTVLPKEEFDTIPQAEPLSSGALRVKAAGPNAPKQYLVSNNQKRFIINPEVLDKYDFEQGTLVEVNGYMLSQIKEGPDIT